MKTPAAAKSRPRYYGLFWRWHFFAALIVIPFVLWQSTTGTIYLWSEQLVDALHPELRFVAPARGGAAPSAQLAAALAALPYSKSSVGATMSGMPMAPIPGGMNMAMPAQASAGAPSILDIILSDDPRRSTTVIFSAASGLPYPVFVDPHTARVLGTLSPLAWFPGWSRSMHGGWPFGAPGSWLLELGDCWAIVMLATGLYLWWPRGRRFPELLMPRFRAGTRTLLRDLHACVAVLFSAVFLFFLVSALPWTSFWGDVLLQRVEAATGQASPAGFSLGGASPAQAEQVSSFLDEAVRETRARGVQGTLDVRLSPWAHAGWWLSNVRTPAPDHTIQTDPSSGRVASDFTNPEIPLIPRLVAQGIHVHQGDFGPLNLAVNTAFALSLIWLVVSGIASWWIRRPKGRFGPPPRTQMRWPLGLRIAAVLMCLALPIFALSVVGVSLADRVLRFVLKPATA